MEILDDKIGDEEMNVDKEDDKLNVDQVEDKDDDENKDEDEEKEEIEAEDGSIDDETVSYYKHFLNSFFVQKQNEHFSMLNCESAMY